MKGNKVACLVVAVAVLPVLITGCAGAQKKSQDEMQTIKTRVETLESRVEGVEMKQAEAERMLNERDQTTEQSRLEKMPDTNISIKSRPGKSKESIKEVQAALKNAGFYSGKIDGVKGRQTRKAIKEFQKANGLTPDGVVGKRTWQALGKYSEGSPAVTK